MRICQSHFFVVSGENKTSSIGQRRKFIPDLIWSMTLPKPKSRQKLAGMSDDGEEGDGGSGQEDEAEIVEEVEEEEVDTGPRISKDMQIEAKYMKAKPGSRSTSKVWKFFDFL